MGEEREGNQEIEWDVGLIGWKRRSLGLWLEVGTVGQILR